jgi:hypothetical protein
MFGTESPTARPLLEEWAYVIPTRTSAACVAAGMNNLVGKNT